MSIVRAAKKSTGKSKYMGFCETSLVNIKNRINETTDDGNRKFPWADIYLEVEIQPKESDYTRNMQICGSFDKDETGKVKSDSATLKRLYWFLDTIQCQAGINANGEWEDEKGKNIEDIAEYLQQYVNPDSCNFYVYIYKEPDRKNPSKSWTRVHNKMVNNDTKGREELESYIKYVREKGYLKEATNTVSNGLDNTIVVDDLSEINDIFKDDGLPS